MPLELANETSFNVSLPPPHSVSIRFGLKRRGKSSPIIGKLELPTSSTVIVKLAFAVFPAASVAVQVTVVVPTEKLEPEAGEQPPTIVAGGEAFNWLNRIE